MKYMNKVKNHDKWFFFSVIYYCKVYDKKLVNPEDILTDSKFQNITYNETSNSDDLKDDVLGIIKIEKIRFKSRDKRRL